ncbi:MAG TPA: FAD-dependent oxidoreductase [Solirubrobacteraceae bacterium]|nr:FAD-dependent oxidoreductase [Solirubrobacteraceae bacterium]
MSDQTPLRIAVIGSGPAGFYAAGHLLADSDERFEVDMIERLPTPWGLVRSGVAPDHPNIKSVTRVYERTAAHPRFRFFGNVTFGADVDRGDLREHYHAIVYATGSPHDRRLGIPGEDLPGSHAATEFVGWYNGHPDHTDLEVDLGRAERAVVIGNGNVALDLARMLVLGEGELAPTDTANHALEVLAASAVREVIVAGRRGPAQAAFTNPELRELADLEQADVIVDGEELESALAASGPLDDLPTIARKNVEILRDFAAREPAGLPRRVVLRFLLSPVELVAGEDGHLASVEFVRNELVPGASGLAAQPTDERERVDADLLFRAVGYRGAPLPGVPFDEDRAVIANAGGRVVDGGGEVVPGEYVVGWIKRGPTGVIGTNKKDAQETVNAMLEDLGAEPPHRPADASAAAAEALLRERQPDLITYEGWEAIDRQERSAGEREGRPRVKLTRVEEMLRAAAAERP